MPLPVKCHYQGINIFVHPTDVDMAHFFLQDIAYEPHVLPYFKEAVQGVRFLDVGANVGLYSLLACAAGACKVIAVEPNPDNANLICLSAKANLFSVKIFNVAASREPGLAKMVYGGSNGEIDNEAGNLMVVTARVDDLVDARVDVLKIDIEGHEMQALQGMPGILARRPIVFSEFYPRLLLRQGTQPSDYAAFWFDLGYRVYILDKETHRQIQCGSARALLRFFEERERLDPLAYLDLMLVP